MNDEFHVGFQSVSVDGYKIITPKKYFSTWTSTPHRTILYEEKISPGPSLIATAGRNGDIETYDPFSENALFKVFAALQIEIKEIIRFADRYGLLGEGFSTKMSNGEHVEPVSTWIFHIHKMKFVVHLWEQIENKNQKWLSEKIEWFGGMSGPYPKDVKEITNGTTIGSRGHKRLCLEQPMPLDLELRARLYLMRLVNEELTGRVASKLIFKGGFSAHQNIITSNSLLGFMWLQLALTIEGNLKYRNCVVCTKPFGVDPSERGKPRRFCSDACKSKDYRNKRKAKNHE